MDGSRRGSRLGAMAVVGIGALLLAACGSSGGGGAPSGASVVGTAIHVGTPTASAKHSSAHHPKHGSHTSASSSTSAAHHGGSGNGGGNSGGGNSGGGNGGGGNSGGGNGGGGGTGGGGGGHPTSSHTSSAPTGPSGPAVTVTPHSGLSDGQTVHVVGTGFTPGERLVAAECVDKGEATGPGDCESLVYIKFLKSSSAGSVETMLKVFKKVGGGQVCGSPIRCLVSVSVPTQGSQTQEADEYISFA